MASKKCRRCGRVTNTALCDWTNSSDNLADRCYAAYSGGKWVKGCAYDGALHQVKKSVDKLIKSSS